MLYEVDEHFEINHEIDEEMLTVIINEVNGNIQWLLELNLNFIVLDLISELSKI
jgi:hypothetical protein